MIVSAALILESMVLPQGWQRFCLFNQSETAKVTRVASSSAWYQLTNFDLSKFNLSTRLWELTPHTLKQENVEVTCSVVIRQILVLTSIVLG